MTNTNTNTDSNIVETIFKTKDGYNECDHCQSVLSPAAYFVKLVETIEKYIPTHQLKTRRPDLFELPLDCDSTNKTKLYLEIANEIMEANLKAESKLGVNALQKLATTKYPFNLPANLPLISIRAYLEKQGVTLANLYKVLKPEADNVAESLGLSPEEYKIITDITVTDSHLKEVYGIDKGELKNVEKFTDQTNIDFSKLEQLIKYYNKIKNPDNKLSINSGTIDNIDQALGFLHRFIRLANKLNWSFDELCSVLTAISKNEIDANSLKEISRIRNLQEKLKKPLIEVCKLYPSASISIEENTNEKNANNAAESLFFLQGVKESDLKKAYGIEGPSEPLKEENFGEFIAKKGLKRQEVEQLLNNYNNSQSTTHAKKTKKQVKQETRSEISIKEQKFLHSFAQLVEQLKLLFGKLNGLIQALPADLKPKFKLKDLITNVNDHVILQKIWNISDEELTSLINYNDAVSSKTEKSLILEVHKQVLLSRLMDISIAEVIQISLHLNISELTVDNVTRITELNDWLTDNSISIEQLNTLVNSSALSNQYTKEISKIQEELEKDQELKRDGTEDQKKAFYNAVLQCIGEGDSPLKSVNEEGLAAIHKFTKKHSASLQLLRLESLDKSIVHDVGVIGNKAIFLGESKVLKKDLVERSISEPRENIAVATVYAKTIFFGGKKSTNEYSKKVDIYDEETGEWTQREAKEEYEARDSVAVAIIGKKAIFFGGNKSSSVCSAKIDIYNDNATNENEKWKVDQYQAKEARANASVAVVGDRAIFFGGQVGQGRSGAIDIYNNGEWVSHTDTASEARANASIALVGTKVIFFGGNKGGNQPSAKVDIYDAADIEIYRSDPTKRWINHTMSEAREDASVAIVDGKAIFFGGKIGETRSNKIDIYDAKTEKWLEVEYHATEARDSVSVTVVGKQAVFFGGCKGNQQYSKYIDVYDSATNSWKATGETNEAHESVSAIIVGTKAIFFTGKKSSTVTGQVYIYDSTSYSKDEPIAKSWIKHTAKETEMRDDLLIDITNSTKYSGKVDIYNNITKAWKTVDIYKSDKCRLIKVQNNKATLTYQDTESSAYDRTYTIGLSITYDATIEELLNNAAVFTALKMDVEGINNITNHSDIYNLKATWTKEQIRTLANYKALQDEFSGNELTLSQYTEWLRDSYDESKVTEKIAQLTNWDKELLNQIKGIDTFGQCFKEEHNPLDSLLKIKSFMDMSEQSAIDSKILLELRDLHNLSASTEWDKYNSTEKKLQESLNYVEGVKEQLEDKKRNILANYMIHGRDSTGNKMYTGIENMRNLYSFLLIDVEMSDCSKISPLKAGLNSLQLYIHRCMLGLEEGATVNPELTEEMWDLLDNYREWEATKKVVLYPENYLNPTLRKSATAEYKALQNTLMQGNITDEETTNVYIKYFEDFAQLVNLEVVDTYFADNKFYILGRTIAEPYIYYYRVGNFESGKTGSTQTWEPWQKIEVQIPVKKARIVNAFGKIFVFWLQKIEQEQQIEDVSINDSTLSVNYVFKKVDGSWSAQQKLPYNVKVDERFESDIRGYLSSRDWEKGQQEMCENWQAKDKETKVNYSKDGVWSTGRPVEEAIEYFKSKVKKFDVDIKHKVRESKNIDGKFDGKLKVAIQNSEILILSCEDGFHNSQFILTEGLTSTKSYTRYFGSSMNSAAEATSSITRHYEEKKEEEKNIIENQIREIQRKIDKKQTNLGNQNSRSINLRNERDNEETSKETLQEKVNTIKQGIPTRRNLWSDIRKLEAQLSALLVQGQNESQKEPIEKSNLRTAINDLKEKLIQSKQKESKSAVLQEQLTTLGVLETEVASLIDDIDKLEEETLDNGLQEKMKGIIKRLDALQLQEPILDSLEEPAVKGKLQEVAGNLRQKLAELKQGVENKKVESLTLLTNLEKIDVVSLEGKINQLTEPEKTIETIEKEKDQLENNIEKYKNKIKGLDDEIKKHAKNIERLNSEISGLQKEKEEIEKGNNKFAVQERSSRLDEKRQKEINLVTKLIAQKDNDCIDESKYEDKKVCQLINESYKKAYINGSRAILAPTVQQQTLDFKGFYGVYLWEIFFHIPTLIAYLFNQEQEFAKARKWYQYIFNPIKEGCNAWRFIPFKTKCQNSSNIDDTCDSGELVDSLDPYKEAYNEKKVSFEKYVIISYVDNLIDWGDVEFSKNSWEGINQATMLYIRAWDLLGERPKKKEKRAIECPKDIDQLLGNKNNICRIETAIPANTNQQNAVASSRVKRALDTTVYCDYFCTPENKKFIGLWDRIEDRLYKIRHCQDIKGNRLELPLFLPPIDPNQLIGAAAGGSTIRLPKVQVPHYRFKYMINYAKSIADTVTQISSELLSVLEKKDAEKLNLIYNEQEGRMANLMTTIKEKAIEALKEEAKALNASLSSAKDRKSHYEKLINDGLSGLEKSAADTAIAAGVLLTCAVPLELVAVAMHLVPNIFGLACGGSDFGKSVEAGAKALATTANTLSNISQNISTAASYERRDQDWDLQKIMATHDTKQISHQIEANKINQANAAQDLEAHKESIKQIKEKEVFFRSKFTNQELYSWMKGELKSLYIRVYRLALEIARQAEWTYQYEIDNNKIFIQPGYWNSLREGLLSGQKLKFDLEQLHKEYHDADERRLEITKVISLKHLDPIALYDLKTKGSCKLSLTEKLFDLDFPGHYCRKIKGIRITIPAVVGPYENVHASLQQTSNKVILKPDANAIKFLIEGGDQPESNLLRMNLKQNQQIAISKGDQDSGLFEFNFNDDRYLPFEGTGAISDWILKLPKATNRFDISSISDVIIHLDYIALDGGEKLSNDVKAFPKLKHYHGTLVANLSAVYPSEWDKFKQQAKGNSSELKFKPSDEIFPIHVKKPSVDLDGENNICIIPITPDISKMTIKVNNYNWERNSKKIVNPSLIIGSDWSIKINNADISKIEEIMIMVPYKATINW